MAQRISVQFGELITDSSVQRAVPLPPGVYEGLAPSIATAGAGWTVTLGVGSNGVSIWRATPINSTTGRTTITEDDSVTFAIEAPDVAHPRIDLLVGAHRWVEGPIDVPSGIPIGTVTSEMTAIYGVVKGAAAEGPSAPSVPIPWDVAGRQGVVLAEVYVPITGTPTISYRASTYHDFARRGLPWGNAPLDVDGKLPLGNLRQDAIFADIPALVAASVVPDSTRAIVLDIGIYEYQAANATAEGWNNIVTPNYGVGRWVLRVPLSGGSGSGALFNFQNFV